jgi:hypothetical protein
MEVLDGAKEDDSKKVVLYNFVLSTEKQYLHEEGNIDKVFPVVPHLY